MSREICVFVWLCLCVFVYLLACELINLQPAEYIRVKRDPTILVLSVTYERGIAKELKANLKKMSKRIANWQLQKRGRICHSASQVPTQEVMVLRKKTKFVFWTSNRKRDVQCYFEQTSPIVVIISPPADFSILATQHNVNQQWPEYTTVTITTIKRFLLIL